MTSTRLALPSKTLLSVAIVAAFSSTNLYAAEAVQEMKAVKVSELNEEIDITENSNGYAVKRSELATKLNLSSKETPASMSVVTSQQMKDFKMTNLNDVLSSTSGVVVEKLETDRTYYTSRGFDITNFRVDGVNMPMTFDAVYGDLDAAIL